MPENPVFTIGYGARELEEFCSVLKANHIEYLIDIRSTPYSSYKPEFSKYALQKTLENRGIRYVFMGETLGGHPENDDCYTNGKVDYEKVAVQPFFKEGIDRLSQASHQEQRAVMMCSEGKPENCHRSKLVGKVLTTEGVEVLHIDENDEIISQEQVILRLTGGQLSLFGDETLSFTSRKRYRDDQDSGAADDFESANLDH